MLRALGTRRSGSTPLPLAIQKAREKTAERGLPARFLVGNVLNLSGLNGRFDIVIDSGLFHTLSDKDRPVLAESLATVLAPGGRYFMLCFSDRNPGEYPLPRRIAMAEIRDTFQDGWSIDYVRPAVFENTVQADGHLAWLASYRERRRNDVIGRDGTTQTLIERGGGCSTDFLSSLPVRWNSSTPREAISSTSQSAR